MPILSIIIVNYKSSNHIVNCIESAIEFASSKNFEWIIVDNDSKDNSKEILIKKFPFIKWIDMGYNAGFARANNAGIKQSLSDTVLLLNPDTIIIEDAIQKCFSKFIQSQEIACSVQLLNQDGSPQISGNYFMKGGLNHLLPLPYLGKFLRAVAFAFKVKKTNVPKASAEEKVDWINGAFLMVKKNVIEKAGLLDEDFFLYAEEAEWCSRLGKYGNLCIYGDYHIIHLQGETINAVTNSPEKGYQNIFDKKGLQLLVSNLLCIRKQYGAGWYLVNMILYTVEIPIFIIGFVIEKLIPGCKSKYSFKKVTGYIKNIIQFWKFFLKILFRKSFFYKVI